MRNLVFLVGSFLILSSVWASPSGDAYHRFLEMELRDYRGREIVLNPCLSPASYFFKHSDLSFIAACPELGKWLSLIHADGISLIFASQYLSNPSSAVGHTYLRLRDSSRPVFLNQVLGFSADVPKDTGFASYIVNGVSGGFKGRFTVEPFYLKFQEYSQIEQRDLWEYQIDLTPEETGILLLIVYELMKRDDLYYYFFTRNCSDILLRLIEVIRPEIDFNISSYSVIAPLRAVSLLKERGLLRKEEYYPSGVSLISSKLAELSAKDQKTVEGILQFKHPPLPSDSVAAIDLVLHYLFMKNQTLSITSKEKTLYQDTLIARSQIAIPSSRNENKNLLSPLKSPKMTRISTTMKGSSTEGRSYGMEVRPFVHGLMDRPHGYLRYSEMSFLKTAVEYQERKEKWQLDSLEFFSLKKFTPYNFLTKNWSYTSESGIERDLVTNERQLYLKGFLGLGRSLFNERHVLSFGFAPSYTDTSDRLSSFALAPTIHFIGGNDSNFLLHQMLSFAPSVDSYKKYSSMIRSITELSYSVSDNIGVRAEAGLLRQIEDERGVFNFSLFLDLYF